MLDDIKERMRDMGSSSDSYKADEYRLMSDGLRTLSTAVEKRQPIKDAAKAIIEMDEGVVKKGKYKAKEKIESEIDIEDLVDEDYIEDEGEEEEEGG